MKKYLATLAIAASALSVGHAEEPEHSSSWKLSIVFEELPQCDAREGLLPAIIEEPPQYDIEDFSFGYSWDEPRLLVPSPRELKVLVPNPDPHSLWPFIPRK